MNGIARIYEQHDVLVVLWLCGWFLIQLELFIDNFSHLVICQ